MDIHMYRYIHIYEIYIYIYIYYRHPERERGYLPCIWPATAPESGDSAILILGARSLPSNVL